MRITHFDEARSADYALGHLTSRWTLLGESAGSVTVGLRRIEIPAGHWSTPAHEHGREEEIFYVLAGRGLSWQRGRTGEIRAGDCIVYLPRRGAHSIQAIEPLDLLAFGPRLSDESPRFPRLGLSLVGNRVVRARRNLGRAAGSLGWIGAPSSPPGAVSTAGPEGLRYLAYGTRDPSDVCYYPRSGKIAFQGVNLIGRIERLEYWDGED